MASPWVLPKGSQPKITNLSLLCRRKGCYVRMSSGVTQSSVTRCEIALCTNCMSSTFEINIGIRIINKRPPQKGCALLSLIFGLELDVDIDSLSLLQRRLCICKIQFLEQ